MHGLDAYRLAASADIAVGILLNADGSDVEYMPLQPRRYPDATICALEIQWAPRCLHFAGVLAWADGTIQAQLEAMPEHVAKRLKKGFEVYLTHFSTSSTVN